MTSWMNGYPAAMAMPRAFNDLSDDTALLQESTTFEALATYYRVEAMYKK